MDLKQKLNEDRVKKELSLRQLAKLSGVSFGTVFRIENGTRIPKFETVEKIFSALGYSDEDIIKLFLEDKRNREVTN
ncbi:MAG: helix-turn-helix domain-containing protein [Anaerorhabdus sp.]